MELGIKDKLAVVTGASKGIGKGIALALAQEGARVAFVARDKARLEETLKELPGGASRHRLFQADLMTPEGLAAFTKGVQALGAPEIVVHNLGGSLGITDPWSPASEWERVWRYNVGIGIELNRAFIPEMIRRKWGRVVHLSTLSHVTFSGNAPYVASKTALTGYIKTIGREVAKHGVVVSAIAPGAIYSQGRYFAKIMKENPALIEQYYKEHLPAWRLGTAEEIGRIVAFLCSDHAGFMTGSIVAADGGGM